MKQAGGTQDLFGGPPQAPTREDLAADALLLRSFVMADAPLQEAIQAVLARSPWRQMTTMRGYTMSVAMSNCGTAGWISDRRGYRYSTTDPLTGQDWPALPPVLQDLAARAAAAAGYARFTPDACLLNRYLPGTAMGLHQDRNERDLSQPIVSVSLGIAATFLFGGAQRSDPTRRVELAHGDVVVWGGASRLHFHGIAKLKAARHPFAGEARINLTFRRAL